MSGRGLVADQSRQLRLLFTSPIPRRCSRSWSAASSKDDQGDQDHQDHQDGQDVHDDQGDQDDQDNDQPTSTVLFTKPSRLKEEAVGDDIARHQLKWSSRSLTIILKDKDMRISKYYLGCYGWPGGGLGRVGQVIPGPGQPCFPS